VRYIIPFQPGWIFAQQSSAVSAAETLESFHPQAIRMVFLGQVTIPWTHP